MSVPLPLTLELSPAHETMLLDESGIKLEVAEARAYRTVTDAAELQKKGFSPKQHNVPALLIPIYSPAGHVPLHQSRPDTPRLNDKGKAVKYETPSGSSMALDVHPFVKDKLGDPNTPLFVTEGIKKGDALVSHGLCAVALIGVWNWRGTNGLGGKTALPEWEDIALNGREVFIVFDSDVMTKKPVHTALARLKGFLEHRGAKIKLIYLPGDDANKQGVDDYLVAGHSVDDLFALASSELRTFKIKRPTVVVNGRFLRDITADALEALEEANDPPRFFLRGNALTRVMNGHAEALTNASLKGELDRCADFMKETIRPATDSEKKEGKESITKHTPSRPPNDVPADILSSPDLPFPKLTAISRVPVVVPGGEILLENGYDSESGILLELDGLAGLRSDMPINEALALLDGVYGDFPFAEREAGRAHALALTLQPLVRPLIEGPTPLYLIDAPARGTGKGLLSETAALITTGRPAPVMSQPKDGDELEKRITAALLEGRPFCLLDNVTAIKSEHLAAVLTSEIWQGRKLGKSEMLTLPNTATWLATGNNVEISDEFVRRVIPIRLDAGVERPEERKGFRHANLPEYVKAHRSSLVSACLSLIQAWLDAGMPKGQATLGRYESWTATLGGILEVAGVPSFLKGRERLHAEADSETTEWAAFTERWWSIYGERAVTAKDLFEVLKEHRLLLELWGGRKEIGAYQRIGRALSTKRDRVFGGYKIRSAGKDSVTRNAAYRLERTAKLTPQTPPNTREDVLDATSKPGVSREEKMEHPETPTEPLPNTQEKEHVQHSISQHLKGDTGVSGVPGRPATEDDLTQLIGATEGEL